jgi:hypothetical protein
LVVCTAAAAVWVSCVSRLGAQSDSFDEGMSGYKKTTASGVIAKLQERLQAIATSLEGVAARRGTVPVGLKKWQQLLRRGLEETAALWPPVRVAYRWVKQVARLLKNEAQRPAREVRRQLSRLLSAMRQAAAQTSAVTVRGQLRHFVKVTKSYWPGLFACPAPFSLSSATSPWVCSLFCCKKP